MDLVSQKRNQLLILQLLIWLECKLSYQVSYRMQLMLCRGNYNDYTSN